MPLVLRHRKLVQEVAVDGPAGDIVGPGGRGDVELVDLGRDALRLDRNVALEAWLLPEVPPLSGNVQTLRRRVDGLAVGQHARRVHDLQPTGQIDRRHGEHVEARKLDGGEGAGARDEIAFGDHIAIAIAENEVGDPVVDRRLFDQAAVGFLGLSLGAKPAALREHPVESVGARRGHEAHGAVDHA